GERNGQEKEGGASNKEDDQNVQDFRAALDNLLVQQKRGYANNTNRDSNVSPSISVAGQSFTNADNLHTDPLMPDLEDTTDLVNTSIFSGAYDDEDVGAEVDLKNLETTMNVSPIPITRIHKDHPKDQIIGDINSGSQTRRMTKIFEEHAMVSYIKRQRRTNHKDYQNCLFSCFLSQIEPKKVIQALTDPSWIEAMQEKLLQFKHQKVWTMADLPKGYTQEEGIDYDEVFALAARIEAIRLFLAYASFMRFIMYQMDVKSTFLYGSIEEEVYVCQLPGFEDPQFLGKVYKVEKALYGLHQAPRAWFQVTPKSPHLNGVKRDFRYLKALQEITIGAEYVAAANCCGQGTDSGSGPRCQDTILRGVEAQIRFEAASKQSNNPPLSRVNTLGIYAARHTLTAVRHKLVLPGITPYSWFWTSAKVKTVNGERQIQALVDKKKVIISETSIRSDLKLDDAEGTIYCLPTTTIFAELEKNGGGCIIEDLDADAEGIEFEKVVEEPIVSVATTTKSIPIKTAKPKPVTTAATTVTSVRPRAKGIIFHDQEEQKKDQVALDEEMARNLEAQLQAELIKEERLARQKEEEANIALIKSWDNTQAMTEADFELA
ncbi:putative ribonuclease H-like domain-containing protein, partial [Tanacetum coccineum]